jgi:phosphatidylethanolamine N-methyltransferase
MNDDDPLERRIQPGPVLPPFHSSKKANLQSPKLTIPLPSTAAAAFIIFNPTFWNTAARTEYRSKTLTRLAGNNPYRGCYLLAVTIFSLGIARDLVYERALRAQPTHPALLSSTAQSLAIGLLLSGNTLVLSSMWALGVTGTYLGDYFGILMDEMVTGFPFSVTGSPMYVGSTLSFLGTALWFGKPAGVVLTALVWVVYSVALRFEDPFTAEIYAKREREQGKKAT